MNIAVKRNLDAAVTEYLGKRLDIKSESDTVRGESVTEAVEVN